MMLMYACLLFIGLQIWLTRHGAFIQQIRFRTPIAESLLVLVIAVMLFGRTNNCPGDLDNTDCWLQYVAGSQNFLKLVRRRSGQNEKTTTESLFIQTTAVMTKTKLI